jgi:predicted dehydrogenase
MARGNSSRRAFLKAGAAAATAAVTLPIARGAHAAGSDILKIGLIGCGRRGTGAAVNALSADPHTRLIAMADLFPENIQVSRQNIKNLKGDQAAVADDHCFIGFESYKNIIACGVDVVLIALPTYFHPAHLKACVDAGKHVFCEKIHAVDAPGVRMVLAAGEVARQKNLSVVSGLAWRYDTGVLETMKRVHDGAIGRIVAIEETCNTGSLPCRARQPGWTEMQYQIQDWFNFYWLGADLPALNLVHNLDKAAWALHEEPPVFCTGTGGRQARVGPQFGDVWDHHSTVFHYASGVRLHAYCRQQDGCPWDISDRFYGTKGTCDLLNYTITGENPWRYGKPASDRFTLEHVALFSAIRSGKPLNNSLYMARSSMLALMCTWASYTGQNITWEEAMKSEYAIVPKRLAFDAEPPTKPNANGIYPVPVPGVTKFL